MSKTVSSETGVEPGVSGNQWRRQRLKSGEDFRAAKTRDISRGVRGHSPPRKIFEI